MRRREGGEQCEFRVQSWKSWDNVGFLLACVSEFEY
jgi:hypothetical protein